MHNDHWTVKKFIKYLSQFWFSLSMFAIALAFCIGLSKTPEAQNFSWILSAWLFINFFILWYVEKRGVHILVLSPILFVILFFSIYFVTDILSQYIPIERDTGSYPDSLSPAEAERWFDEMLIAFFMSLFWVFCYHLKPLPLKWEAVAILIMGLVIVNINSPGLLGCIRCI